MKFVNAVLVLILLAGTTQAAITVAAHYTFNDNSTPAGFSAVGTPTYSGGQLVLNGTSALTGANPLGQTDNFGMEIIVTPQTPSQWFAFYLTLNNSAYFTGNGFALMEQNHAVMFWTPPTSPGTIPNPPPSITYGQEIRLAAVRESGITTVYLNNVAQGTWTGTVGGLEVLNIGVNAYGTSVGGGTLMDGAMKGSINDVRLFTFSPGQFNASTDLLTQAAIPEPSMALLALFGVSPLMFRRSRRSN